MVLTPKRKNTAEPVILRYFVLFSSIGVTRFELAASTSLRVRTEPREALVNMGFFVCYGQALPQFLPQLCHRLVMGFGYSVGMSLFWRRYMCLSIEN